MHQTDFPYRLHSATDSRHLMNQWGSTQQPFFFVLSYDTATNLLLPLSEIDPCWLQYDFGLMGTNFQPDSLCPPSQTNLAPFTWEVTPPSRQAYQTSFDCVMKGLQRGDSFLTNLTACLAVDTSLTLSDIFRHARAKYKLWWRNRFTCFSPETFVRIVDGEIATYPMKGTISQDLDQAETQLLNNQKEAAEHATIVDLLRNDLSIIATSVHVPRYRYLETVPTHCGGLLQSSSEIRGILPSNYLDRLGDLFFSLLPAGSITGAPKVATQSLIAQAENYDRAYYTGVMGLFDGQNLDSAVMIRFVETDEKGNLCFKAGGGITAQSQCEEEYQELISKAYVPIF